MARKHYRAVKKQVEHSPAKGMFISNKQKPKLILLGVSLLLLAFLKGLLLGFISGKHD